MLRGRVVRQTHCLARRQSGSEIISEAEYLVDVVSPVLILDHLPAQIY